MVGIWSLVTHVILFHFLVSRHIVFPKIKGTFPYIVKPPDVNVSSSLIINPNLLTLIPIFFIILLLLVPIVSICSDSGIVGITL